MKYPFAFVLSNAKSRESRKNQESEVYKDQYRYEYLVPVPALIKESAVVIS